MYPVLLLCQLCSFNASSSVESRNNILLSQLLFFYFLIFFSLSVLFFPPPLLCSKQCAIQHGISWRQSSIVAHYKSSTGSIVCEKVVLSKPGSHLLPLEMLSCFCLGRETGSYLMLLRDRAICSCLWIPVFVDVWVSHCNCWHSALKWWKTEEAHRGVIEMGTESLPNPVAFCTFKKPIVSFCSWLLYLTSAAQ